jgi:hypothetical protein
MAHAKHEVIFFEGDGKESQGTIEFRKTSAINSALRACVRPHNGLLSTFSEFPLRESGEQAFAASGLDNGQIDLVPKTQAPGFARAMHEVHLSVLFRETDLAIVVEAAQITPWA